MRRTWKKAKPKEEKFFRANNQISSPFVFLINEDGVNVGKVPTQEALIQAMRAELDLVEVNPSGEAPVCKIMDFGQFKYEKEKKAHKARVQQKKVDTKGVRLSVRIGEHDFNMRLDQGEKFLKKGDKLKVELMLRGREKAYPDKAREAVREYIKALSAREGISLAVEQDLTVQGGKFIMIVVNKKD